MLDCKMNMEFDYFENVDFAVTVCDRNGIVLYQNARAIKDDGKVIGLNLFGCHKKESGDIIRHMIESGESNTCEIIRQGHRKLIHRTPWFESQSGIASGLIEVAIDLP